MTENTFDPIAARQQEVDQYQANIALYTGIAATLPSEWPESLLKFKGSKKKHDDIAKVESLADVELLADLWAHDDAQAAIRTETLEMRKAQAILNAIS